MTDSPITDDRVLNAKYVIGLDIGDGESALAWSRTDEFEPAEVYERHRTNEKSIITALSHAKREAGRYEDGKYLIGEDAVLARDAVQVRVNFKERPVPGRIPNAVLFGQALLEEFFEAYPKVADQCLIFVGHPAGWPADAVRLYGHHMRHLGPGVELLTESQSALVYVRDINASRLAQLDNVLVVDIGSSTIDFTIVEDLVPRNIEAGDNLGCRQIDEHLAGIVKARLSGDGDFAAALGNSGGEDLLLLACRRAKEAQFSRQPQSLLDNRLSHKPEYAAIADRGFGILKQLEIPNEVTAPGGWASRFEQLLDEVRKKLSRSPDVIILTGGGSRMTFVTNICKTVFPYSRIDRDKDPSLSVARGLASAGCQRVRVARFRRDISATVASAESNAYIRGQTTRAFEVIKESIAVAMKSEDQSTWADLIKQPPKREEAIGELRTFINSYFVPEAQQICTRYGIESTRFDVNLTLPPVFTAQLIDRVVAAARFQGIRGETVAGYAVSAAVEKGLSVMTRGFIESSGFGLAALIGALAAGAVGIKWGLRKWAIEKVRSATLPAESVDKLAASILAEVSNLMDQRAAAVERFVR